LQKNGQRSANIKDVRSLDVVPIDNGGSNTQGRCPE